MYNEECKIFDLLALNFALKTEIIFGNYFEIAFLGLTKEPDD
jgi:hypothetical protein